MEYQGIIKFHADTETGYLHWEQFFYSYEKELYDCILRNEETFESVRIERNIWLAEPSNDGLKEFIQEQPQADECKLEQTLRQHTVVLDIE